MSDETLTQEAETADTTLAQDTAEVGDPVAAHLLEPIGGGAPATELHAVAEIAPADDTRTVLERRAARSALMQAWLTVAGIARPVAEWGLLGQGAEIAGHMGLVDVESLARVRAFPGAVIAEDRVFANARNIPADVLAVL